jgi:glycosyltransferase involved in cell wall biosynthesis
MNLLSFVHLRNIHGSTGAGRVARQLTEHIAVQPGVNLRVLADKQDHERIVPLVGRPWSVYDYHFFQNDTSRQQAEWVLTNRPAAESFWPDVEITHCTMESYVPTRKGRLAVTMHDAAYFERGAHPRNLRTAVQRWKWKVLFSILARKADVFHTVSNFSAERLAHFFPSIKSRLRVVPNAPMARFNQPAQPAAEHWLESNGFRRRPYVLLPGGLHFRKNAELVMAAWRIVQQRNSDAVLVISNHCQPQYRAEAGKFGDSVVFAGFVDDEQLCSLYHGAQATWFPSRYEGFGIPILESMCCGTPVVANNCSAIPEVAGNAALLASADAPAHAEALLWLLRDSAARERYRNLGRERARQFSWESSAVTLTRIFQDLL